MEDLFYARQANCTVKATTDRRKLLIAIDGDLVARSEDGSKPVDLVTTLIQIVQSSEYEEVDIDLLELSSLDDAGAGVLQAAMGLAKRHSITRPRSDCARVFLAANRTAGEPPNQVMLPRPNLPDPSSEPGSISKHQPEPESESAVLQTLFARFTYWETAAVRSAVLISLCLILVKVVFGHL